MSSHKRLVYCREADKYSYSSEAKAMKFVNSREDLVRCYYCPHCDGYHTTSKTIGQVISYGVLDEEEIISMENYETIPIDVVVQRLRNLKERL